MRSTKRGNGMQKHDSKKSVKKPPKSKTRTIAKAIGTVAVLGAMGMYFQERRYFNDIARNQHTGPLPFHPR